jgi:hypothetical protein
LKLFFIIIFIFFNTFQRSSAQCQINFFPVKNKGLLIQAHKEKSGNDLTFNNRFYDEKCGNILIDMALGILIDLNYENKMDFIMIVFELKSDTLFNNNSTGEIYSEKRAFYLNKIAFNCILRQPKVKIILNDETKKKYIEYSPQGAELQELAECISKLVPKEEYIEHYNKVLDSLLNNYKH